MSQIGLGSGVRNDSSKISFINGGTGGESPKGLSRNNLKLNTTSGESVKSPYLKVEENASCRICLSEDEPGN